MNKLLLFLLGLVLLSTSCKQERFTLATEADDFFFLRNGAADMPVWVQGNTASKTILLLLHGGPGGSAFIYNELLEAWTDPLEQAYGIAYWEQRGAGGSQGNVVHTDARVDAYVDDLDKLIILLKDKYGEDVSLFLMGLSWGGYLSQAYLIDPAHQANVKGCINIVGPHNMYDIGNAGRRMLLAEAPRQIARGNRVERWEAIRDFCASTDTIADLQAFIEVNRFANEASVLIGDSLNQEIEPASFGEQLAFAFSSPVNAGVYLSNLTGTNPEAIVQDILDHPLDVQLAGIQVPALIMGGAFDYVVPPETMQEQYDLWGSADKELYLFPRSSHSLIANETAACNTRIMDFVERYR